jgi:SAM-dependent methyltransferase
MGININYSGFDYSETVIDILKEQDPDITIWQEDATKWKPEAGSYDIIILVGGLHHVPNHAAQVVQNLSHGLKDGGIFINFEPTYGNVLTKWVRKKIYQKNPLFDEKTERDFSVKELKSFFLSSSLSPVRLRYPGLLSYILFYNPDAFPFLNKGGEWLVKATFLIDRIFYKSRFGAFFSFATLSIWRKDA